MTEPLFSSSWYRVADLRPRLAPQLRVVRQPVRDQVWHVLTEAAEGRQLRLNPSAWEFAARCDGERTVAALWDLLVQQLGDAAPTQDDILRLLAQLYRSGMVQFDAAPHLSMLFARQGEQRSNKRRAFINPLILRMRLVNPTRVLDWLEPLLRPLLGRTALVIWAVCVALAALACIVNFGELRAEVVSRGTSTRMLWLAWLCYPVIKLIHEMGHAVAVRRFGGTVHEMGITLFFFTPAPYVDASSASSFERRNARIAVSAAGIMVELAIAALAAAVWFTVQPGLVRDTALVTLLICTVSTLLFNGNPLLRLDGYYVMTDALDLPNLAARSKAWWQTRLLRWVRGPEAAEDTALAQGERKWLAFYAPASWFWRTLLLFTLVAWVGSGSWLMGWVAALGLVGWMLYRGGAALLRIAGQSPGARARVSFGMLVLAGAAGILLFAFPAPSVVVARGVVWPPEGAQLRPQIAGFIAATPLADGALVSQGDVVVQLAEPALQAERDRRAAQLDGLQSQQYQALLAEPARAADLAQEIGRSEAEIARADEQLSQLQVRGPSTGRLVLLKPQDLPGSFAARGAMLGYILTGAPANVRAVMGEEDVLLVRGRIRSVQVRLADTPGTALAATLDHEVPGAANLLPTAALGDQHGGAIPVDPADKEGLRTTAPVFMMDVSVPAYQAGRIGSRAWVRFELEKEPIGWQWTRRVRQLLLRQFNPVGQV